MASLDTFKLKFDDQLTCSVCLDQYFKPKTLPCVHSFCLECIQRLPVERKGGQYCIKCPTCRIEYPLPEGGAADLPNAFHINSFLELREELANRKSSISTTVMTCSKHNDPLKVYCETCRKLICRDCTISKEHKSHEFKLVIECYPKHCRKIEAELKLVQKKLADTDTAMAGLTAREREVTDQGEEIKNKIRTHAQQLIDQVVRSERHLMQEVDTTVQHKRQLLRKQREEAERVHSQLKICKEMIEQNLKELSQEAFLKEKEAMLEQMKSVSVHVEPEQFQPLEEANVQFTKFDIHTEKGFGKIRSSSYGKAILDSLPAVKPTVTLSLQSHDGSPFSLPSSLITCTISSPSSPLAVKCDVHQTQQKGKYKINYNKVNSRRPCLQVKVGGVEVPGSPFMINLLHFSPVKTINLQYEHYHLAVCDNGDILATEQNTHTVTILDKEGRRVKSLGTGGTKKGQFIHPYGVAVSNDGHVLVTDQHQLQKLTFNGVCVKAVGSSERGSGQLQFSFPAGIAVHPTTGQIFVADEGNNRVQVFDADLNFSHTLALFDDKWFHRSRPRHVVFNSNLIYSHTVTVHGDKKLRYGQFHNLHDVALDSEGYLYVAEWYNHCIAKLTIAGQYITRFGSEGSALGQLQHPHSLTIHNNLVYVSEWGNNRVSIFTTQGTFLHCFGKEGSGKGDFNRPWGVAVDRLGNLYVSDCGNKRIVVY